MFSNPDFLARRAGSCLLAAVAAAVLAACSTGPSGNSVEEAAARMAVQSSAAARPNPKEPAPQAGTAASPATDAALRMLAYADRVRLMPAAELGQEVTRLGDVSAPAEQFQLSLVLSQLRQLPELIRAQELLARVLGNANAEAQALHPLARLLASRYAEQRRLEEQLEKQTQQVREVQRRLDQTNERLEALKAIERSLTSRPPAAASSSPVPAPANRSRTTAP